MKLSGNDKVKIKKNRDHDYLYDPTYIVSHRRDFMRQARKSAMASAQCTLHPVFETMFSELTRDRRINYVCHPNALLPEHVTICYPREGEVSQAIDEAAPTQLKGKYRALFFSAPITEAQPQAKLEQEREATTMLVQQESIYSQAEEETYQDRGVQTLYRESSAQTDPYQPEYYISRKCNHVPEILLVDNVDSSHEGNVLSVERQRIRRAWLQNAMDLKVLTQLDQFEYKCKEKEVDKMLILQEEKYGTEIVTTVDKQRLNNVWAAGTQRLQKQICQIRENKERDLRKLEVKRNKLNATRKPKHCPSICVKKPLKLAVNLKFIPDEDHFPYQAIDLNPKVTNKYGICDKFMKKRERHMLQIKRQLKKILEPEQENISDDEVSREVKEEKGIEEEYKEDKEEGTIAEVEKVDKSVGVDFLFSLLVTGCEKARLASLEEHYMQVKKKVMTHILNSFDLELDQVIEERKFMEMLKDAEHKYLAKASREVTVPVAEKTSREQFEMYQEVIQVTQDTSSKILNAMFKDVSDKIVAEKIQLKSGSMSTKIPSLTSEKEMAICEEAKESQLADVVMDIMLPLVVQQIEKKVSGTRHAISRERSTLIMDQETKASTSAASFMSSIFAQVTEPRPDWVESEREDAKINPPQVDTIIPQLMHIVHNAGLDVLDGIFNEMAQRVASWEFRMKYGLDDESTTISIERSNDLFINEIIMHDILPDVIETLRMGKKMESVSIMGFEEEIDDRLGNMVKVVGAVQEVASSILSNMIEETTHEPGSTIQKGQSPIRSRMDREFIQNIIMDTLMPEVVEEIRRRHKYPRGYPTEEEELFRMVITIQHAVYIILEFMFTTHHIGKPKPKPTCIEQPIEEYLRDIIVSSLPKHIRVELNPKYHFDFEKDTLENFMRDLIVSNLPKCIREEFQAAKDITQVTKFVELIQKATTQVFEVMFEEVAERVTYVETTGRTPSEESFFVDIILGGVMPRVMAEIDTRNKLYKSGSKLDVSQILKVVTSEILGEFLDLAKCGKTVSILDDGPLSSSREHLLDENTMQKYS